MTNLDDNYYTKFDPANPPPPLMTGEPGSFAHKTMATRVPSILQTVIDDHIGFYPPEIIQALHDLRDEVRHGQPVKPLETNAPDSESWTEAWRPYRNKGWLDIPWYFAESFVYRRLLEAVDYFGLAPAGTAQGQARTGSEPTGPLNSSQAAGWTGLDPFLPRKQAELQTQTPWQILALALKQAENDSASSFQVLLQHSMWGNRVDLSHAQLAQSVDGSVALEKEQANLVVNDMEVVLAHWQQRPTNRPVRPDFICDNAGTELLLDLALTDFLLRFNWAGQVTLHLKAHPTFVSDATPADVERTLASLKARPEADFVALATRLETYRQQQRLHLRSHLFWNSSRFFWELPAAIESQLSSAYLVIIKGDANYRRLLGDSQRWPAAIPVARAIPYFPASLVALRTLKSDPIVGLNPGQAETLSRQDADWRVNGRRGMIQAVL